MPLIQDTPELREFKANFKKFRSRINKNSLAFIFSFAIAGVSVGLWLAWRIYHNYLYMRFGDVYFERTSNLEDLGSVLSGTVGIIFTLVGIVLLAFTLYQTHQELNETQTILKNQLVESTFFNLLKNHKEVILNKERKQNFDMVVDDVKSKLLHYREYEHSGLFPTFEATRNSPVELYKRHQDLRIVGQSLVHIANLIELKLEDKEFYHKTLYYNLSENEMFLFGLIIDNKLDSTLMDYKFYYREDYNKFGFRNSGLNLPGMELKSNIEHLFFTKLEKDSYNDNILTHETSFNIIGKRNDVAIEFVEYDYRFIDRTVDPPKKCNSGDRFRIENHRLNFMDLFNQTLFEAFKRTNKIEIDFNFVFKINDYQFCVQYRTMTIFCKEHSPTGFGDALDVELSHFCRIHNVDKAFHISVPAF